MAYQTGSYACADPENLSRVCVGAPETFFSRYQHISHRAVQTSFEKRLLLGGVCTRFSKETYRL